MALPSRLEEDAPSLADDVVDVNKGITNRQAPVHDATPVETVEVLCSASKGLVLATAGPSVLAGLGVVLTQGQACVVAAERVMARVRVSASAAPNKSLSFINVETAVSAR